jgi:hypothetical protein
MKAFKDGVIIATCWFVTVASLRIITVLEAIVEALGE